MTTKLNWNEHTIHSYQADQEQALNTTNPNTTINHTTAEDLNDKPEHAMASSARTTQEDQLHANTITNNDHDEPPPRLI